MPQKTPPLTHTNDALFTPPSQDRKQGDEAMTRSSKRNYSVARVAGSTGESTTITAVPEAEQAEGVLLKSPVVDSYTILSKTEASAEELMNLVFEDVDYMLDKGVSLVPTTVPESVPKPITDHGLAHQDGAAIASRIEQTDHVDELASFVQTPLSDELNPAPPSFSNDQAWGRAINITLPILGACAALGVALAAGFILYSPLSPWNREAIVNADSADVLNDSETEFASYMQRALDTIARSETSVSALAARPGDSDDNSTSAPFPNATANGSFRSSGIPQRVYIPVYQPPSPSVSTLPSVPVQRSLTSTPDVTTNPSSSPPSAPLDPLSPSPLPSAASPPPSPSAPSSPTSGSTPTSTQSITPTTTSVSPPAPTPAPIPTPTPSAPVVSALSHDHVLVGLLQLGERSEALFDFAEGTHRVKVGEQIGNSGWSLVSVSRNEAVIRRNGDVRSIYIGQSF